MIAAFDLTTDADAAAEGTGGVQIHVDITQVPATPSSPGGLATTGGDIQTVLIVAGVLLIAIGIAVVVHHLRRRA